MAIQKSISVDNVAHMLATADARSANQLRRRCLDFLLAHFGEVIVTPGFLDLPRDLVSSIFAEVNRRGVVVGRGGSGGPRGLAPPILASPPGSLPSSPSTTAGRRPLPEGLVLPGPAGGGGGGGAGGRQHRRPDVGEAWRRPRRVERPGADEAAEAASSLLSHMHLHPGLPDL